MLYYASIFILGAGLYVLIELFWRGRSHWSMGFAGGLCFVLLDGINHALPNAGRLPLCLLGALTISAVEFVVGSIVNIGLGLNVWDYSGMKYNLYGQVSLKYSLLWIILSIPVFILSDVIYTLMNS